MGVPGAFGAMRDRAKKRRRRVAGVLWERRGSLYVFAVEPLLEVKICGDGAVGNYWINGHQDPHYHSGKPLGGLEEAAAAALRQVRVEMTRIEGILAGTRKG